MAHPINDALNKIEKREPKTCDSGCEYWKFPHLETACVLSAVFTVRKGDPCFEYKQKSEYFDYPNFCGCKDGALK